jgi:hypothetical protein
VSSAPSMPVRCGSRQGGAGVFAVGQILAWRECGQGLCVAEMDVAWVLSVRQSCCAVLVLHWLEEAPVPASTAGLRWAIERHGRDLERSAARRQLGSLSLGMRAAWLYKQGARSECDVTTACALQCSPHQAFTGDTCICGHMCNL